MAWSKKKQQLVLLLLLFIITFIGTSKAQEEQSTTPVYLWKNCSTNSTTNNNNKLNLRTLFSSLSSNTNNTEFYNTSTATLYGLFMCRGDVGPSKLCQQCVFNATQRLLSECSLSNQAVIWYDECMVRYSNRSFFSTVDTRPRLGLLNTGNVSNPDTFMPLLFRTINKTADEAANHPIGFKKYATMDARISGFQNLYCMAQCTPDLSPEDCRTCLTGVIGDIPWCCTGKQGGRVLYPSCNFRYELYPFYRNHTSTTTNHSSPSPSPSFNITPPVNSGTGGISHGTIVAIVLPITFAVLLFILGICFLSKRAAKKKRHQDADGKTAASDMSTMESLQFDFGTIQAATNKFSGDNKLGEGGFGEVYKGTLPSGQLIAVKRAQTTKRNIFELMALAHTISALATTLTLPKPPLLVSSPIKTSFLGKQTNPRSRRNLSLTPRRVAAPPTTTIETDQSFSDEIEDEFDDDSSSSKFTWRDHWYPVSLIEDLNPSLPTPFQLLGREIVLWYDNSNSQWVAFDDKCPHRLAPLSEGRIDEGGNLQCSYHGWSFDGRGSCVVIPQAASEGPEARAVQSPRACATRFPTLVSQGLLFVWPDENGWEKAKASKLPLLPDDFKKPEFATVNIQRDLFYGYDTLMENVSDPSHIDFAHHKVTGRRDRAKPLPFKMESRGPWGFAGANEGNPRISSKFIAPCYYINKVEIDTKLPVVGDQKWVIWICSFNVPMAPGKTRSIVCSARNFFQFTVPGPAWWQVVPRWYEHWTSNKVYDGDMIVLQGQEKVFLSETQEGGDINKQYTSLTFTPTQADRFVLAFRNWLRRHGNGEPEWFSKSNKPLPSTVLSKREMLDRFEQHTLKCSSCKGAYEAFKTWQKILIGTTVVFCATSGIPSDTQIRIVLAGLAVISAALAFAVNQLQKNFVFVDYVHAEID